MTRTGRKCRFLAANPLARALSHRSTPHEPDHQEQHQEQQIHDEVPIGVTPPSPVRLPDSALALICPHCEIILYISRGMLSVFRSATALVEPFAPGQIDWLNPRHMPCHTIMAQISLDGYVPTDAEDAAATASTIAEDELDCPL